MTETLALSAPDLAAWFPLWKAAGFFFATFILEDAAAIGAGLLLATGGLSWPAAFTACFLGIWLGDAGLYALARVGGRRWFDRSSWHRFAAKVTQCEGWFARRGTTVLIFSRMVPGARLPTYLAAGFLRVPLRRFLLVTGMAAFVWTFAVLWLAQTVGARVAHWLGAWKHGSLILLGAAFAAFVGLQFFRRAVQQCDWRRPVARLGRWQHWEFWPAWAFYPPVIARCLWLAVKYRGLTTPTAANPGIFSGGIVGESKSATLADLSATSPEFTAPAALISGVSFAERWHSLEIIRAQLGIDYPFILKPEEGQRGLGVKLIRTATQAEAYLRQTAAPLIAQRYAAGPGEAGVFYYRFPHESTGNIFAITEKIFPVIIGDGRSTITDLIAADPRARFLADKYLARFRSRQDQVLGEGESLKLVEAGNHAQGCIFREGMHLCTPALTRQIDEISQKVPGFFIGRYDIRYPNDEDLRAGINFQIIELNGAASEATSIYDARTSLLAAYRTLFRQWELVFAIGAANRQLGCRPTSLAVVWKKWREQLQRAATYPAAD